VNPLRTIVRDLVERRLWPVAALMVALVIAVPVLFLRPAPSALDGSVTPAAPTAAPATAAAATTTTTTTPATTAVGAEPNVKLTTSPFSAAFGAGTSLPPSMESLIKSTESDTKPASAAAVAAAPLHDPFAPSASSSTTGSSPAAPAAPASTASTRSATTTSTTPTAPASTTTPSAPFGGGNSSPAPTTDTTPTTTSTPSTPTVAAPTTDKSAADSGTVYHADVSFGTTATAPVFSDARRLTAFPSSLTPIAVYLGVMRGGWGAVFALKDGTQPTGAPSCRPRKQLCGWVILHPGEAVTLNDKDPVTGATTAYTLKLVKITHESVNADAAAIANGKASTAGRCLLGPLAAYRYDSDTGTLAARPELKSCKYAVPGQDGQPASVRNAHIG
jgi:hypothetical protein